MCSPSKNKLGEFICEQVDVINLTDESITSLVDIIEVQEDEGIYYLDKQFYSEYLGLSDEKRECFASLIC